MKLQFFDPKPYKNDYVSRMFLAPMRAYARDNGIEVRDIPALIPSEGWGTVCNADWLVNDRITEHRKSRSPMFAISCIDSAWLSESLRFGEQTPFVDRIFMVSGIQNTNESNGLEIDSEFNIKPVVITFLPDETWKTFNEMRERGQLCSLPYVPWSSMPDIRPIAFPGRRPTILFRGGNHFFRVLAYFQALQKNCADDRSGFMTQHYFDPRMNPQFRYCDECREIHAKNGERYPFSTAQRNGCTSPAEWGGGLSAPVNGQWNNRCPASYYWLAEKFMAKHGEMDRAKLEAAMNFRQEDAGTHLRTIGECRFYADAKWEFSINMAQRFWEGANAGTVNLLPRHANDQDYFPAMKDGEHYKTFADDFLDITADISEEEFNHISGNAKALYSKWIRASRYAISDALLDHIFNQIRPCLT